jgi:hypothetical protein
MNVEMTWKKYTAQWDAKDLVAMLPGVSQSIVYAWQSGDREPPVYVKNLIKFWISQKWAKKPQDEEYTRIEIE